MPTLKGLTCNIEIDPEDSPLPEYGTSFRDGFVQTLVPTPARSTKFSVHLTSDGYIAPGLGMFVFIDSVYQCNRVRQDLQLPCPGVRAQDVEINFRVRQKEERLSRGTYIGREWMFESSCRAHHRDKPSPDAAFQQSIGFVEVVVLRCFGRSQELQTSPLSQNNEKAMPSEEEAASPTPGHVPAVSCQETATSRTLIGLFDGTSDIASFVDLEGSQDSTYIKDYWAKWRHANSVNHRINPYTTAGESTPRMTAETNDHQSHRLRIGQGAIYTHKTGSPVYMDSMERPYAVFWFGYRSREAIEDLLGISIPDPKVRNDLLKMSKEQLIAELLEAKFVKDSWSKSSTTTSTRKSKTTRHTIDQTSITNAINHAQGSKDLAVESGVARRASNSSVAATQKPRPCKDVSVQTAPPACVQAVAQSASRSQKRSADKKTTGGSWTPAIADTLNWSNANAGEECHRAGGGSRAWPIAEDVSWGNATATVEEYKAAGTAKVSPRDTVPGQGISGAAQTEYNGGWWNHDATDWPDTSAPHDSQWDFIKVGSTKGDLDWGQVSEGNGSWAVRSERVRSERGNNRATHGLEDWQAWGSSGPAAKMDDGETDRYEGF